ncbi:MAG TPA: methyltransferase, partial [Planctomycetaceae bacterium]|nr:methyltransferase [Planctomycetaceae bacterium]
MTSTTDPTIATDASPRLKLFQLLTGHYVSQALYVAAKLGIADLLVDGPRTSAELAQATKTHAPSLLRLLRLLASAGVLAETGADTFALTPVGAYLSRNHPDGSSHAVALLFAGPINRAWNELLYSVQTGEPAFERVFGMKVFEYLPKHPEEAAVFNEAMTAGSAQTAKNVPTAYDFSSFGTLVDAGGGHGALLAAILRANPRSKGILFELPSVAEGARKNLGALGLSQRYEVVAGDFFESVPAADAYILKGVIHDWDRERSIKILQNCRRAMRPPGKLLLVELVLPSRVDES